ncbi:MAG: YdcF family protein [Nitrospiraceae bacterium]|nr:YdcF family protein [Nitrospiraceae bacterium]
MPASQIPKSIAIDKAAPLASHGWLRQALRSDLGLSIVLCLLIAGVYWAIHTQLWVPLRANEELSGPRPRADVVVVLAGEPERWNFANALIGQGYAPRILSTLTDPACLKSGALEAACRTGVRNTVDEAVVMRRVLSDGHVKRATVVTSDYHALRTAAIFAIVFAGSGIEVEILGASTSGTAQFARYGHELVSLGPSVLGALASRLSPPAYEYLLSLRHASSH